ncbi:PAS domain S-box protein [Aquitalea aquatilis]|uniref:PAS domain S-box protein n=1 Tax=Aquitalea aquatilis TaxID=1537400 RepID=UPI0010BDCCBD|nr:PAS domain S-box protein [Aquitalea aquatilis]
MYQAPFPVYEQERLHALHRLELLDTPSEPVFDSIVRILSKTLEVPICLFSLVDKDRQWFKSSIGLDSKETSREVAFCAHTILDDVPLVIPDARQDARFSDNPLVTGFPGIRFYAGMPITTSSGLAIGTLCAIDTKARAITAEQLSILEDLSTLITREVRSREAAAVTKVYRQVAFEGRTGSDHFKEIFERAGVGIALVTPDGEWVRVNDSFCTIVGYSREELSVLTFQKMTYADDLEKNIYYLNQLAKGEIESYQFEKRYIHKDGNAVWVTLNTSALRGANEHLEGFVSFVSDISQRKEAEAALAQLRLTLESDVEERTHELHLANEMLFRSMVEQSDAQRSLIKREAELAAVIDNAYDAYISIDDTGVVISWNHQAEVLFGWSADEAIGQLMHDLIVPEKSREGHQHGIKQYMVSGQSNVLNKRLEFTAQCRDGGFIPVEVRIKALTSDDRTIFCAFLHDITARKEAEKVREEEARRDALTGLPNRRAFFEVLPQAMARAVRWEKELALLFIDLDGFKGINDHYGHKVGDALLCQVANRLSDNIRKTDSAFRLAGDEFVIILEGLHHGAGSAVKVGEKIVKYISHPVVVDDEVNVTVSASIGFQLYSAANKELTVEQMLNAADQAMYKAKGAGRGRVEML